MKLIVLAIAGVLLSTTPPFPLPKLIPATAEMRCDWGPIASLTQDPSRMVLTTEAGPLTVMLGSDLKIAGADGKALPSIASLQAGQPVRVYYVVKNGARAQEIDVIPQR